MNSQFKPITGKIAQATYRSGDIRLSSIIRSLKSNELKQVQKNDLVLLGAPDDRGVKLNRGREGAKLGPSTIRSYLYGMTPPMESLPMHVWDLGDFIMGRTLTDDQKKLQATILEILSLGARTVLMGGGHDWGYCDSSALAIYCKQSKRPHSVINIDAHLDYRPYPEGPHSGSPFRQLLDDFPDYKKKPSLFEWGVHYHCNSPVYVSEAKKNSVTMIFFEDMIQNDLNLSSLWKKHLTSRKKDLISLSIDLDGIQNSFGVSASYPYGLCADDLLRLAYQAGAASQCQTLGCFETNPKFDLDHHTSKRAAHLIFEFIRGHCQR